MAKRTGASQARRARIKVLNDKVETLVGQIQSLKFQLEDARTDYHTEVEEQQKGTLEDILDPDSPHGGDPLDLDIGGPTDTGT